MGKLFSKLFGKRSLSDKTQCGYSSGGLAQFTQAQSDTQTAQTEHAQTQSVKAQSTQTQSVKAQSMHTQREKGRSGQKLARAKAILCAVFAVVMAISAVGFGVANMPPKSTKADTITPSTAWYDGVIATNSGATEFEISTAGDLYGLAALVNGTNGDANDFANKTIKLIGNIDLGGSETNQWDPIGIYTGNAKDDKPFSGTFDGSGYKISGLYINKPNDDYVGLFGGVNGGTIKNLGVAGSVTGYGKVGGIVGVLANSTSSIVNCYNEATVKGKTFVGGIVGWGYNCGNITKCYNAGNLSWLDVLSGTAGGIVGSFQGSTSSATISECYNAGNLSFSNIEVGGIAGKLVDGEIKDCFNVGNLKAGGTVGGIVAATTNDSVKNCFNAGNLSGKTIYGTSPDKNSNCFYYYYNKCGVSEVETGRAFVQMLKEDSFSGFDFDNVWEFGAFMPQLKAFGTPGSESNPYLISNKDFFERFADLVNGTNGDANAFADKTIKLTGNIDLGGSETNKWTPIGDGNTNNLFKGTFDGSGHIISGLYVDRGSAGEAGLFGYVEGGTIKNLGVYGTVKGEDAGGIVGTIFGYDGDGGLIENCFNACDVTGSAAGGIVGRVNNLDVGRIKNCYNVGDVAATQNAGGIAGDTQFCGGKNVVHNCLNLGNVKGAPYGAITGSLDPLTNCYSLYTYSNDDTQGTTKISLDDLKNQNTFSGFDFVNDWEMGLFMPQLKAFGGAGSENNPYLISSKQDFENFAKLMIPDPDNGIYSGNAFAGKYIKLTCDIDLGGSDFTPLGLSGYGSTVFKGTFDGDGHVISGLYINKPTTNNVGLFSVNGGTIKNLGVYGTVIGNDNVGGIVGQLQNGIITNCYAACDVTAKKGNAGGLVGLILAKEYRPLIGVNNSFNLGTVSGYWSVGGIAGKIETFIGIGDSITTPYAYVQVKNCFNAGTIIKRTNDKVASKCQNGGIVGSTQNSGRGNESIIVTGCYYLNSCGADNNGKGTKLNSEQFAAESSFDGFDFSNVWEMGLFMPQLKAFGTAGSESNPYLISNKEMLTSFASLVNGTNGATANAFAGKYIKLTCDINLGGSETNKWTPIGVYMGSVGAEGTSKPFSGTFDGGGHEVSGMYINSLSGISAGLFGYATGTIKNLGVSGEININFGDPNTKSYFYIGGIVGYTAGGIITNCYNKCNNNYSANRGPAFNNIICRIGGIAGYFEKGSITNCYNLGDIRLSTWSNERPSLSANKDNLLVGGIVAEVKESSVSQCYNDGNIKNCGLVGGIVGYAEKTSISQCFNSGNLTDTSYIGGIVFKFEDTTSKIIENCYNVGALSGVYVGGIAYSAYSINNARPDIGCITNCFNTGVCSGTSEGRSIIAEPSSEFMPKNCYYLGSDSTEERGTALNEEQFKEQTNFEFDFDNVWEMGSSMPQLRVFSGVKARNNSQREYKIIYHVGLGEITSDSGAYATIYVEGVGGTFGDGEGNLKLPTAQMYAYKLSGWYADSSFSGEPITSISQEQSGDIHLYAKFKAEEYTLNISGFIINGSEIGDFASHVYDLDSSNTLSADTTFTVDSDTITINFPDYTYSNAYKGYVIKSISYNSGSAGVSSKKQIEFSISSYLGGANAYNVMSINVGYGECSSHVYDKGVENPTGTCTECGADCAHKKADGSSAWGGTDNTECGVCGKTHAHAGGVATCQAKAVCTTCTNEYGELGAHDFATEWTKTATEHYHACLTDGCTEKDEKAAHTGGVATCQAKAVCTTCTNEYGELGAHDFATEWTKTDTEHYHACLTDGCTEKDEKAAHTGGVATCQAKAVCATCTNEYGELGAHDFATEWTKTDTEHYHACLTDGCTEKDEKAAHTGGVATCQAKAVCTTCTNEYGELGAHDFATEWTKTDTEHYHACLTDGCTEKDEKAAHTGGVATCQAKAVCATCTNEYGELGAHDFATEWTKTDTEHYHACLTDGCTEKDEKAAHTGGVAICIKQAECDTCHALYGKLDSDNHVKDLLWVCGDTFHLKQYECCGAITVATEAHAWNGGVCSECGFKCSHRGGTATCNTRAKCTNCGSAYGLFDATAHNLVLVERVEATASSVGNVEHYRCSRCAKTFEDALGKISLDNAQIVISKLAPQIIEGAGQTHAKGNKQLVFRSNAAFGDFIRVTLDGFTLPLNHYEVKEGSTIVILNEECLSGLSEGEHVLEIVSVSGAAKTTFTVAKGANSSGSATVWVWVGVAAAAVVAAAVVAFIIIKKRKA